MSKKKEIISLIIGFSGAMLGLFGVVSFNRFVLMSLPLGARMISMIVVYWLIALIPLCVMLANKNKLTDYGFTKSKPVKQVLVGIAIGLSMSLILTVIPHLMGFGEYFTGGKEYRYLWQFVYEFCYCILAVGFAEEFVFRGFIYYKIKNISQNDMIAVVVSSVLFGIFHIFGGSIAQIAGTAMIGAVFCFCRLKIKNCSALSLIIAHGIYDALITVWSAVFLQ